MNRWGRSVLRWGPVLCWMALIYFLSSRPDLPHMEQLWMEVLIRKTAHALEYGVLGALLAHALGARGWRGIALAAALSTLYAASDEWHQTFVQGRIGNLRDVLLDSVSATIGARLYDWVPALKARKRSRVETGRPTSSRD